MVSVRRAEMQDLQHMQHCNLWCLPENYTFKYYLYHGVVWQSLLYVSEDLVPHIIRLELRQNCRICPGQAGRGG